MPKPVPRGKRSSGREPTTPAFSEKKQTQLRVSAGGAFLQSGVPAVDVFLKRMELETAPAFSDFSA
jgi:hypothetical protein